MADWDWSWGWLRALVKKLHASKDSIQHQMAKQDIVLERLTLVAMRGWPEYHDKFQEAMKKRNNAVGMSFSRRSSAMLLCFASFT